MRRAVPLLLVGCLAKGPADDADDSDADTDTDAEVDTDDTDGGLDTDDTDAPSASCVLGTGEEVYQPLGQGSELVVIRGPQGGWHVLGSVRCLGVNGGHPFDLLDPSNPTVSWRILDEGGAFLGGYENLRRPMGIEGGPGLTGEFLVLRTRFYAQAVERDVTMHFRMVDVDGVEVEAGLGLRLVAEEDWTPQDTGLDTDPPPT